MAATPHRRLRALAAQLESRSASAESFEDALLKFALPSGSLQDATVDLFARANFNIEFKPRDYFPDVDDPEIGFISFRAQEVSRYVEAGVADCGITGRDWIIENGNAVRAAPRRCRCRGPGRRFSHALALLLADGVRGQRRRRGRRGGRAEVQQGHVAASALGGGGAGGLAGAVGEGHGRHDDRDGAADHDGALLQGCRR